jgi:acyl-CoA synthetase (AMP-forming)/AMP-acid ligase II
MLRRRPRGVVAILKLGPVDLKSLADSQLGSIARRVAFGPLGTISDAVFTLRVLTEAGVLQPVRPDKLAMILRTLQRWGASPAAGIIGASIERPDAPAVTDEADTFTFADVHRRSNALARGLRERGVREGDGVAVMCRNHHGFIEATLACSKLGANALYLNTAFAAPQLADVVHREGPSLLIYDDEFTELLSDVSQDVPKVVAWRDDGPSAGEESAEDLIAANPSEDLDPPQESSRFVILTSGTTGTPKGAQRAQPDTLGPLASLFSKLPFRSHQTFVVPAPLFHSWGFSHFIFSLPLRATLVLRRHFDPEEILRAISENHADVLVVVPVMMQRILELPPETIARYDTGSLKMTSASGSALPGELATKWMDTFGDNLYNLYGSTEVAWATIATPEDLRAAPGTAGLPPRGTVLRILDHEGQELPPGKTGRIFVGNEMAFEGYTGGGGKEVIEGLMSTGDVGHIDSAGRLFVDGRDDEMIVSGGENVFPREVEDLLADHDAVTEAAVIGVEDEEFGQRLKAFVVLREGEELSEDEIKGHVKANLARYKIPREVEFLDSLPRNATGKILKRELA